MASRQWKSTRAPLRDGTVEGSVFRPKPSEAGGGGEEPYSRTATNPDAGIAKGSAERRRLLGEALFRHTWSEKSRALFEREPHRKHDHRHASMLKPSLNHERGFVVQDPRDK